MQFLVPSFEFLENQPNSNTEFNGKTKDPRFRPPRRVLFGMTE